MDVVIESTKGFEQDLDRLQQDDREAAIAKINDCASLFPAQKAVAYRKLHRLQIPSLTNGYQSSLYTLKVSQKLSLILAVDEDPIFEQIIFTLFRATQFSELKEAYQNIAVSLYQDLHQSDRELVGSLQRISK